VCATSYLNLAELHGFLTGLPRSGVYQGPVGVCQSSGQAYVSGSCIVMSSDVALDLVRHTADIVHENAGRYEDDVALARWIAVHLSNAEPDSIASRIAAGERPTGDDTFVHPPGRVLIDYRSVPRAERLPVSDAFHYHFDSDRMADMVEFHEDHFDPHRSGNPAVMSSGGADHVPQR